MDVLKAGSKKKKDVSARGVDLINILYNLESVAKKEGLSPDLVLIMYEEEVVLLFF